MTPIKFHGNDLQKIVYLLMNFANTVTEDYFNKADLQKIFTCWFDFCIEHFMVFISVFIFS